MTFAYPYSTIELTPLLPPRLCQRRKKHLQSVGRARRCVDTEDAVVFAETNAACNQLETNDLPQPARLAPAFVPRVKIENRGCPLKPGSGLSGHLLHPCCSGLLLWPSCSRTRDIETLHRVPVNSAAIRRGSCGSIRRGNSRSIRPRTHGNNERGDVRYRILLQKSNRG